MKAASAAADVTAPQIAMIHVLAKQAGLDEDCRRDAIEKITGKRSARDLTAVEGSAVIDHLKCLSKASEIDGPYGKKLRALWISGWHLGVVHDRTDKAMLSFVERQTGIERTRWLRAAADARKAVEALKIWLAREGGVQWPAGDDPIAVRRAVIEAQQRKLAALGETSPLCSVNLDGQHGEALDRLIKTLGAKLREASAAAAARY